jgi:transcriptional regulator with XRE-family HTH domain
VRAWIVDAHGRDVQVDGEGAAWTDRVVHMRLTLGWRLQMALRQAGVSVQDMDELGIGRNSLSRWMNDRGVPRAAFVKQWALRTGVPYAWLATGEAESPRPGDPGGGSTADAALCARRDSNPQPSDPKHEGASILTLPTGHYSTGLGLEQVAGL